MKTPKKLIKSLSFFLIIYLVGYTTITLTPLRGTFYVFLAIIIVLTVYIIEKKDLQAIGFSLKEIKRRQCAKSSILAFNGIFIYIAMIYLFKLGSIGRGNLDPSTQIFLLMAGFFDALTVALLEELAFRGYIQSELSKEFSELSTILTTALLFALLHTLTIISGSVDVQNWAQELLFLSNIYVGGLILSILKMKHGNLNSPIIFHFTWNYIGYYVLGLGKSRGLLQVNFASAAEISGFETGIISLLALIITLSLIILNDEKFIELEKPENIDVV